MEPISVRSWTLLVLSVLLQIVSFPTGGAMPVWRSLVCWVALTPFLLALLAGDRAGKPLSAMRALSMGYLCGIGWYLGSCSWIYQTMYTYGGLSRPVSLLILVLFSLYLGLYHGLFALLVVLAQRGLARGQSVRSGVSQVALVLALTPFLWTAVELARARITYFPWDLLGNAAVDNTLLTHVAPLAGVMGMSFLVLLANTAVAGIFMLRGLAQRVALGASIGFSAIAVAGILPSPVTAPAFPGDMAVMMQENLEVGALGRQQQALTPADELRLFRYDSLHPEAIASPSSPGAGGWVQAALAKPATVILWPEAPSHLQSNQPWVLGGLAALARSSGATVVAGALGVDFSPVPARGYYLYDSALVFNPTGDWLGRYDKIHLVPWGEYIPFKEFFSFAQKLTEGVGDMDRGVKRSVFTSNGHRFGVFICYESIFGDEVRHFVLNGAEVLVNISDDGWYGESGAPWQHLNMARMRAIENHSWILRSTNTGVTTAIDPEGHIAYAAPRHVRAAFAFPFAFAAPGEGLTLYTRFGDWFAWMCVVVAAAALGAAWLWPAKTA